MSKQVVTESKVLYEYLDIKPNFLLFKLFFVTFFVGAKNVKKKFSLYIFFLKENERKITGDQWSPLHIYLLFSKMKKVTKNLSAFF